MSKSLRPHGQQHTRPPCPLSKLMSIKLVMSSNHLILCRPLLLLPSIFPSIRVFSNELVLCIRWPKYWSFSFSISPASEYSGLISFRMDWLDLLAVQGTLKSLLQHHSSKASILQCSAFFIVQLSHPYVTTEKTIALTSWTFAGKVMYLFFNRLSRLVIVFLPRSKYLNFMAAVSICSDLGAPKEKFSLFPLFPHLFAMKWWDQMSWSYFSECWVLSQVFHSPLSLSSRVFLFFFAFCHKGGVICIPEVIDISPGNLDSSLCFIQPGFRMMYYAYKLNKQGDNIQPWCTPFPIWNRSVVPCPVLTVASWPAHRFLKRQVRWSGISISWRISYSLLWSTQSKALA